MISADNIQATLKVQYVVLEKKCNSQSFNIDNIREVIIQIKNYFFP